MYRCNEITARHSHTALVATPAVKLAAKPIRGTKVTGCTAVNMMDEQPKAPGPNTGFPR